MSTAQPTRTGGSFASLRRFVRDRPNVERCELCSFELAGEHQHLVELSNRRLVCACDACAILFGNQGAAKYRRVPGRVLFLGAFRLTDAQWDSLLVPIDMAFFFNSSSVGKVVAYYPSPAGPTESQLGLETWDEVARENAILTTMEPDVEALLINRVGSAREYYLVPIDQCYKLVGLIRAHWTGLSGGAVVWKEIAAFFSELRKRSGTATEETRA